MRSAIFFRVILILLAVAAGPLSIRAASTADIPRITKDGLKARMGEANMIIIDVRLADDWDKSEEEIAGSVHHDPDAVESWSGAYSPDQILVLYCA
jgi:rhodanese-related sulfurtransferase